MALKKSIALSGMGFVSSEGFVVKTGITNVATPPLYIKVISVSGSKSNITASVTFTDEVSVEQLIQKDYVFTPKLEGVNFIAQAYEHLKTLPEFAGATDC
jgi:hypothetical protein